MHLEVSISGGLQRKQSISPGRDSSAKSLANEQAVFRCGTLRGETVARSVTQVEWWY